MTPRGGAFLAVLVASIVLGTATGACNAISGVGDFDIPEGGSGGTGTGGGGTGATGGAGEGGGTNGGGGGTDADAECELAHLRAFLAAVTRRGEGIQSLRVASS